jgi:uncharacterized membrane protein SirB2
MPIEDSRQDQRVARPTSKTLAMIGVAVGVVAVTAELAMEISGRFAKGDGLAAALAHVLAYFTIVSNVAVVLAYTGALRGNSATWLRPHIMRGMTLAMIALVMLTYFFIISRTEHPRGIAWLCAMIMHYVTPPLYALWWVLYMPHGQLKLRDVGAMLVPSVVYMIYVLIRGRLVGEYPYAMLDATRIGSGSVTLHAIGLLVALAALCAAVIALDRWLARRS